MSFGIRNGDRVESGWALGGRTQLEVAGDTQEVFTVCFSQYSLELSFIHMYPWKSCDSV